MKFWILVAVLSLGACASGPNGAELAERQAAQDDARCQSFGAARGSDAYVKCRTDLAGQHAADERARKARAAAFAASLQNGGGSGSAQVGGGGVHTTCFKKSESSSGFNKICYYDCLGSAAAITQSNASLCPLTIEH